MPLAVSDCFCPCSTDVLKLAVGYGTVTAADHFQGLKGPTYGASVALKTQMTLQSDSVSCVSAQRCLPLGGYSVWAAVPPFQSVDSTSPPRKQVVVMSHWDSRSLFRYMAKVRYCPLGLDIAVLFGSSKPNFTTHVERSTLLNTRHMLLTYCYWCA